MRNCFALITERHFSWWAELSPKRSNTCNLWSQQKRYFKSVPLLNQLYSNTKYKKNFFKSPPLIGALLLSFAFHEYLNVLECCCCSVTKWCLTLSNPMDCSMPGLPVHHQLPEFIQTHVHWTGDAIQPSHPLSSPSRLAFSLSQHQGLFRWLSSSHQVAKVLEFQRKSLQWIFRTDFLQDGLVGSPCSPRNSQESSLTPQFKSINSSALSFL